MMDLSRPPRRHSGVVCFFFAFLVLAGSVPLRVHATVVGTSVIAPSITQERIDALPEPQRAAWTAYLRRSHAQEAADRAALAAERQGLATIPPLPPEGGFARSMPMDREPAWYATPEARHIGDVIVSFQTPGGGWSKNMNMGGAVRLRGQRYAANNLSRYLAPGDFDTPRDPQWNYISTLDNDSTNTEIHFLALLAAGNPGHDGEVYRASYFRGIRYLLNAQFPNGGWPQVWPLEGGYHDAITFNDNAVTESAESLTNAASGVGPYSFVPGDLRRQAAAAAAHALDCILATQIVVDGRRTIWAQQHDALTLVPVSGRNYEMAALSSGESADVLLYLMSLPHPSAAVRAAIAAGVDWLKSHAVYGFTYTGDRTAGRKLVTTAGAGPIWARYYSLTTGKPIFGDRDRSIHDDVNELSLERRNGYSWWNNGPQRALDAYAHWRDGVDARTSSPAPGDGKP
jgi:PelA/Pel-15E family pectate lyase